MCMNHVPPITLPATSTRCWMVGCSIRPEEALRPEPEPEPAPSPVIALHPAAQAQRCAYALCDKPARPGSKYCSRACSNRNARKRHKERKAA
jgi:hypothetical protein